MDRTGDVTVNGTPVRRVAARAALGDVVAVTLPADADRRARAMAAENISLRILYEDEHLLASTSRPAS